MSNGESIYFYKIAILEAIYEHRVSIEKKLESRIRYKLCFVPK